MITCLNRWPEVGFGLPNYLIVIRCDSNYLNQLRERFIAIVLFLKMEEVMGYDIDISVVQSIKEDLGARKK